MPITIPVDGVLGSMIDAFPTLFSEQTSGKPSRVRRLALTFLVYLLGDSSIPCQRCLPEDIAAIIHHINQRPGNPWRNPDMAKLTSLSTESFIRRFKRWTGETPIRYVQQVRVREACRLLTATDTSIDEIALQSGFPDRFYFSRVFKRHTSHSPAAYRRATRSLDTTIDS